MVEAHFGAVYKHILKRISESGGLTFLQMDPPNLGPKLAGQIAKVAEVSGVDAFAVGGSVGAQGKLLDDTLLAIKDHSKLPTILFPGNVATVSQFADAIYFMYMMNSLDPYYITGAQTVAAAPVKTLGLEAIPTSYTIIEPGMAVGWVGRAKPIPRNLPYLAGISALAGQYMGSHLAILESGGGSPSPAPTEMISYTKKMIDIPLIVAGGVRNERFAHQTIKAGADIIHVGTAMEKSGHASLPKAQRTISKICQSVKKAGKEKL